jgi:ABC-type branched-subunit amino acid transport system substrate-binding protein
VAVLYQNDDLGQSLLDGFTEAVEGTSIEITAQESYEPSATTVKAQMTTLEASGADFLFNASAAAACTQMFTALDGGSWDPQVVQGNNCNEANISQAPAGTTDNIYGAAYLQSPLAETEGMELFREIMESAGVKPTSTALVGFSNAQAAAAAISAAEELSSIGIAQAAAELGPEPPSPSIYLEGTTFKPGLGHPLLNSYRVAQYDAASGSFDGDNGELITVD